MGAADFDKLGWVYCIINRRDGHQCQLECTRGSMRKHSGYEHGFTRPKRVDWI
jgi:hypothetical protein